ncbi:energy transducer TonB [Sphingomonas gei]|nr:energy transducer TonB [Sphingomonas gei]
MGFVRSTRAERARAGLAAAALTAALGYALVAGLALGRGATPAAALQIFEVGPEPPPPPREKLRPHQVRSSRREGAASPPNLRSEPTEIVAPAPVMPVPSPVIAAPIAGVGSDPSAGSADIIGPGTGSGGEGNGRGSGGGGDGDGDGGTETAPRQIRGDLRDADYPPGAAEAGIGGTVSVRYYVETDGHVSDCDVTRSSGNAELDAATCGFIVRRFRFRPARDGRGRPVPAAIVENHSWMIHQEPAEAPPPRPRRRFGW